MTKNQDSPEVIAELAHDEALKEDNIRDIVNTEMKLRFCTCGHDSTEHLVLHCVIEGCGCWYYIEPED